MGDPDFIRIHMLPCSMLYYEEKGDGTRTVKQRCCTAFTYTFGFIVIVTGLFVVGFFVSNDSPVENWDSITSQFTDKGQRAMEFVIAIFTTIGMIGQVTYTAFGLAILPITIARDKPTAMSGAERDDLNMEITSLEKKINDIDRKRSKSHADEMRFRRYSDQLKRVKLQRQQDTHLYKRSCFSRCGTCLWNCLAPFRVVIGITLWMFSALIAISLLLHGIDQAMNGEFSTGFALKKESIANPLGLVLAYTSSVFPLDYILFSFLVMWLFVCTLFSFSWTGIRCFCIRLTRVKKGRTMHNSLALLVWTTIMIVLSFSMTLMEVAPKYTEFGHQFSTTVYTDAPTKLPTMSPTRHPSRSPTQKPTISPTHSPTFRPSHIPTKAPSLSPTHVPTPQPTESPTNSPTNSPTDKPTATDSPTHKPTQSPTNSTNIDAGLVTSEARRLSREYSYNVRSTQKSCSEVETSKDQCTTTQIYSIYQYILVKMPIFGAIYFGFQFLFIFTFLVGSFCCMRKAKPDDYERMMEDNPVEEVFY